MVDNKQKNSKVGAVMVVGAGIGGIQASLDLAEMGFKVYLVEKKPAIGGVMAQLDKTFPTNDCSMCLLSPKLVDTGRHPNIKIITNAQLESIEGGPGNFKVKIKKLPTYVDPEKCTGCGECTETCNVEVPNEFDWRLGKRKAIYRLYPQAIPNTFSIQKIGIPPCRNSCPTGVNIQGFVALIRQKKYAEALALFKEKNPFPGICGRICHHPCEVVCNRGKELDEPIASRYLHRFLADLEMKGIISAETVDPKTAKKDEAVDRPKDEKVAIVGSGPAGLTVAYDLANMGYKPTVFEALPVTGGMLRVGIPKYRLPEEVIDFEIEAIKRAGVEIKTNTPIGPDLRLNDLFTKGYKAIFIAIGTHKSRELNIEGEDLQGVIHGIGFLKNVKIGKKKERLDGKLVAVVGGGNVALDSVRTALRLGAKKAFVIYRRSKKEMPVFETELEAGEQEGVEIHYLASPIKILGQKGKVIGIECIKMKLGEPDRSGRRRPIPIEGSEFTLEADVVIPAVSQSADLSFLTDVNGIKVTKDGVLPVEGVDLTGVYGFTDFLREASLGRKIKIGPRCLVIGGGNVAIDVARTLVRLGAKEIHLVCLEKRKEMPSFKGEVEEAEKEGVIVHNSLAPVKILGQDGKATGVAFVKCVSVFDDEGNFNPKFDEDKKSVIESETITVAIGQVVDYSLLKAADGVLVTKTDRLQVDDITYATNMRGVFAGGDVIGGPGLALSAIAQGHEAAISIDRFLRGEDLGTGRVKKEAVELSGTPEEEFELRPREMMKMLSVEERIRSFDEVELGFSEEQALVESNRCLNCSICAECMQCVVTCKVEAINHQMKEEYQDIDVGAVIMAMGQDRFEPKLTPEYGYDRFKNVITSPEFERILSASGPYEGHLSRPSDGKEPKRIAFIQCVGSRDIKCNPYCSSVCCMYATKEAIVAKEHAEGEVECDIYFMDLRAFGKGFDRYYERAKQEYKIKYRRARIPEVEKVQDSEDLILKFVNEDGVLEKERYDMVVLSTGLVPAPEIEKLKEAKISIKLNKYNFIKTNEFSKEDTSREGIYVCGAISEPKDIPETVIQASAAAARSSELLASARGTLIEQKVYPEEIDVAEEPARIGVFVCHCGINIGGIVNVKDVVEATKALPQVVFCEDNLYTCSQDTQELIKERIKEHNLNRVVIASCTPRTHEALFQDTIREAGLNPFLLEFVSIREMCSWVHMQEKAKATQKSKELVSMAVAKAAMLRALVRESFSVNKKGLVIGGGISGMNAALSLAEQQFETYLIEKEEELGGNLRDIYLGFNDSDPQKLLKETIEQVEKNDKIHVYKNYEITEFSGYMGNYKTTITSRKSSSTSEVLEHGIVIVATGAKERQPGEYLYGKDDRVITQREFEEKLTNNQLPIADYRSVVMIQCVGSREGDNLYCSRVCCSKAIKNALKIKEINPATNVYVLYRDIRTYGFKEEYYQLVREKGVIFIRYDLKNKPEVGKEEEKISVKVFDPILWEKIELDPSLLVLSTGIAPNEGNKTLGKLLKVPLNEDNFFLEAHIKLRPVDFSTDGIFLCGLAHSPKFVEESISQARATAARAVTILSKDNIQATGRTVWTIERLCIGCGVCVPVCPYEARDIDEETGKVRVREVLCQGCGACVASCLNGATQQFGFEKKELLEAVDAVL